MSADRGWVTRSTARRVDWALCAVWLTLAAVGLASGWPPLLIAFFAFAGGERWGVSWYR